jgi:RNA polymerase sigma factor (sigma-70 family)
MIATKPMSTPVPNDADLVRASLAGNRSAFGQIVARYQSLICSLAYSATGSLNRSEDLAQDTFIAAWRQLAALREPAKLRVWLCGIARNLISNAQRRAGREPAHLAGPFDPAHDAVATEASPPEQAVSREEEAILWRALEKIPETYREPLVLFYREHRSVESVARELELTEDAVKQRLSRGRALLHEQVLALVEGTLERSNPGQAFTLGVMTALPVLGTGLAAAAGAATTKGAAGAKSATWLGTLGAILTAQVLWFVSSMAFIAGVGGFVGWQMSGAGQSPAERRWAAWFWRLLACGIVVIVFPMLFLDNFLDAHRQYAPTFAIWLGLFYIVPGVPLVLWALENHHRIRAGQPAAEPVAAAADRTFRRWVAAATIGMAGYFVTGLFYSHWYDRVPATEVWGIVTSHPGAEIQIDELEGGGRWINIVAPGKDTTARYHGPLDEPTYRLLKGPGIHFTTRVQGRDYDLIGWPARRFGLVNMLTLGAGIMILIRTFRRRPATA